jgi:hypothetical protein
MSQLKPVVFTSIFAISCCLATIGTHAAETPIPRSVPGDKGKYYLIESKKAGDIVQALHKRVGVDSTGFTRTETNCKTRQMRELGYGEDSPNNIKTSPTKWFDLVPGSSKSDLANFLCKW